MFRSLWLCLICVVHLFACGKEEKFDPIALKLAGPVDVVNSKDGKYFYVLNTDFDRTYNEGSILVIDENGKKIASVSTPRLGRSLTIAGTDLIATFGRPEEDGNTSVHLYDLSKNAEKPELVRKWQTGDPDILLDCTPINAGMRENFKYFAVTCSGGRIYMGELKTPRSASTLKLVRDYRTGRNGRTRRAIHIDPYSQIALFFPTDDGRVLTNDLITKDVRSYDPTTLKPTETANEIPDEYEDNRYRMKNSGPQRSRYQFVVYDIEAEAKRGFPLEYFDDEDDKTAQGELHWLYFSLINFDKTPDILLTGGEKQYRSNIYTTQPHPNNPRVFYMSHRGKQSENARYSNNIIRVTMLGGIKDAKGKTTPELLSFERVYGFKKELDVNNHYPGEFRVKLIKNQLTLLVNHFKDLVNFRKNAAFSIAAKVLNDNGSEERNISKEIRSDNQAQSYYHVDGNERGKVLSCSFYSNSAIPLDVDPGIAINLGWDEIKKIE